jgi:hypothetical protein
MQRKKQSQFNYLTKKKNVGTAPGTAVQTAHSSRVDLSKRKKSITDPSIVRFTDINKCGPLLKKAPYDRTYAEKMIIFNELRPMKGFKNLSDFTLLDVCGSLILRDYEANRAIFRQGDHGTAWYILLSGQVAVQITTTGRLEDSREVVRLPAGVGFGELALMNDEVS